MLSVVIPAYNEGRYLARCLQSLQEQDYQGEYEVIVVDNGSTDGTAEVARRWGATVVLCLHKGVVYARDAGLRMARGDIIVQLDADSVLPRTYLTRVASYFAAHPGDVAVAGTVVYADDPLWHRPLPVLQRWANCLSRRLTGRPYSILAGSFAVRRRDLLAAGGYNFSLPSCGDEQDLLSRLRKVGRVAYDPTLVVRTSARRFRGRFWQATIVDLIFGTLLALLVYRLTGRRLVGMRRDVRVEHPPRAAWRFAAVALVPLVIAGLLLYGFFVPTAQAFGKVYSKERTSEKVIALTFDDGPNEPYTSEVLDILDRYGVKATFFLVGKNVEYYPETARRIVAEGHVVGNHSWSHRQPDPVFDLKYQELDRAQAAIEKATGVRPRLFRPPFGQKTPWELAEVRRDGLLVVAWGVSANDPKQVPAYVIAYRVIRHAHPGAIVLLHDGGETVHGADRSRTVAALPEIIETLQARGYRFVTVPELLGVKPYLNPVGGP